MKKIKEAIISVLAPVLVLLILFGFWQYMCVVNEIPKWLLPSPANIFKCMFDNPSS